MTRLTAAHWATEQVGSLRCLLRQALRPQLEQETLAWAPEHPAPAQCCWTALLRLGQGRWAAGHLRLHPGAAATSPAESCRLQPMLRVNLRRCLHDSSSCVVL